MMGALLGELARYLLAELGPSGQGVLTTIQVLDLSQATRALRVNHIPALLIAPSAGRQDQGPFSNTLRRRFDISLRCVVQSADPQAYMVPPTAGPTPTIRTIHDVEELIEEALYKQKRLTSDTFEMREDWNINYGAWSPEAGVYYPAFDLTIAYTALKTYTGWQNNQDTEALPPSPEALEAFEF